MRLLGIPEISTHRRAQGINGPFSLHVPACSISSPGFLLWPVLLVSISVSAVEPIPLYNLFSNAVIRAQYLHQMAADIYREFEGSLPPDVYRQLSKIAPLAACYSNSIPIPTGKDETQEKSDGYLLHISSALLQSWMDPLKTLSKAFPNSLMFRTSIRISEKLEDLNEGVTELIRVVGDGGAHTDGSRRLSYENFDVIPGNDEELQSLMKNYGLLTCFKKDMHKVETYLRVTKRRRFIEN
ncbi:somatotropin-1-like [Megalops cyprinoides]|uniref:somatotropin-1-like n=1 Tax=Megalops cyprinoides TaxID=118141 RepID=UPI0018644FEC|nr:somatotropin-1-like [Megalops cyprinoides]